MEIPLIIGLVNGYMLKVWKAKKEITKYKSEFNAIRHGNYFEFINLIKEPISFLVINKSGVVSTDTKPNIGDCDFVGLIKSEKSMRKFLEECLKEYGDFNDNEIDDNLFYEVALFEISIRMHANNYNLITEREGLITVIPKLCKHYNIPESDIILVDKGRVFLNMIKHYKNQFPTWEDGIKNFILANQTLIKYGITVI
jgi:hypothetical protein